MHAAGRDSAIRLGRALDLDGHAGLQVAELGQAAIEDGAGGDLDRHRGAAALLEYEAGAGGVHARHAAGGLVLVGVVVVRVLALVVIGIVARAVLALVVVGVVAGGVLTLIVVGVMGAGGGMERLRDDGHLGAGGGGGHTGPTTGHERGADGGEGDLALEEQGELVEHETVTPSRWWRVAGLQDTPVCRAPCVFDTMRLRASGGMLWLPCG